MDKYYNFPWYLEKGKYGNGDTRLSIHNSQHGYIGDVYKQARSSDEHSRELAGGLMSIAPEMVGSIYGFRTWEILRTAQVLGIVQRLNLQHSSQKIEEIVQFVI